MKELITDIRNICEHCINEYNIINDTIEETIEDLGHEDAMVDLQDLTDEMFRYYKRILYYINNYENRSNQ